MPHTMGLQALYQLSEVKIVELLESLVKKGFKSELRLALSSLRKSELKLDLDYFEDQLSKLFVIAIHQPGFLPWPGYFHKVMYSDHFVWLDHVDIARKNFISRVPINSFSGKKYLLIPLKKHSFTDCITSMQIVNDSWKQTHLGQLSFYRKAPFYSLIMKRLKECYASLKSTSLVEINWTLFQMMLELLGIDPLITKSSNMNLLSKKEELMIEITKKLNGNVYLSGMQAERYQSPSNFWNQQIRLIYQDYYNYQVYYPYNQNSDDFCNGLSVIDLLFYLGPDEVKRYIQQYDNYSLGRIIENFKKNPNHFQLECR